MLVVPGSNSTVNWLYSFVLQENTRLHQERGLTISMCNVIFGYNRSDKIGIKKSIVRSRY